MISYPYYSQVQSLNNATATGAGLSLGNTDTATPGQTVPRAGFRQYTVLLPGGPSATVALQAMTMTGVWVTVSSFTLTGTDVTSSVFGPYVDVRLNVTAYTSGNVNGFIQAIA